MRIGDFDIAARVLVIAEIGNNHEGDAGVARELVESAATAGADAVKLQTFRTEHYVSAADAARYERLKRFELADATLADLAALSRERGLLFLSTPFDLESAHVLEPLVDAYKVASGDNTFFPLLDRLAATAKPLLISAGLASLDEIERSVQFVRDRRNGRGAADDLAVLHCVSSYPTPPGEAALRAIEVLRERLGCPVGYSDHTLGIDAAVLSVALGARIVEKHFTLDTAYSDFRDHRLSADPDEFRTLIRRIREAEELLGAPIKEVQPSEQDAVVALRRSIVAAADLAAGHRLALSDLTWVRPGGGLAPGDEHRLVGRTLRRDVRFGDRLSPTDVT
ncbi:MAG TPA: N-acetylneuraminate synthase family protein [Gaiellaceae bacterium]|nr:N-acetylneuraminate synthase family protein [Gaiellaceae bacterium]